MNKALIITFCFLAAATAHAQRPYTPAAGSPERKAIMDVLRVPCEADLRQKVIFRVQHLRIVGRWALARVVPLRPNGSEIDYSKTKYRDDEEEGAFRIRASIEVAADGQSFTASYTLELLDPATGEGMGEYGPGTATGTRLMAEAPGTPVGSLEDLFSQFEGTPEASPVP